LSSCRLSRRDRSVRSSNPVVATDQLSIADCALRERAEGRPRTICKMAHSCSYTSALHIIHTVTIALSYSYHKLLERQRFFTFSACLHHINIYLLYWTTIIEPPASCSRCTATPGIQLDGFRSADLVKTAASGVISFVKSCPMRSSMVMNSAYTK